MPLNLADDKWALVWVMACSHQATSHDLGKYSKLEVRVFLYPLSSAGAELCVVNADGLVFQYQVISSQNTFQHPPGVSGHQWVNEVGEICSGSNQWISSWLVSMSWPKGAKIKKKNIYFINNIETSLTTFCALQNESTTKTC